ncbi:MAG: hypothetical protein Q4F61_01010 [Candidatus Saccharibacteria bacterium]|nr:hypothetical protein [Candidatus Saccharibacteria bacterium]
MEQQQIEQQPMVQQPANQPMGQQPTAQQSAGQQPAQVTNNNKNNSLIVIIISIIVALVAGVVVYFIVRGNGGESGNNNGGSSQEEQLFANPADEDAAYIINIDGKTFTYKNKLKDLEGVGLYVSDSVKNETAKAGKYMIMLGGGDLVDLEKNISLDFMPYNDGTEDVKLPDAKLGTVTIRYDDNHQEKNDIRSQWTFYGGIHLGSTEEELLEVYGEPYDKRESENYKGEMKTTYKFRGSSYQNFEFAVIDGKVTEMSWTNYGSLADR